LGFNYQSGRLIGTFLLLVIGVATAYASPSGNSSQTHKRHSRKHVAKSHGQQKIDRQRAQEIQEALIREHYLSGEASGVWDDSSQKAMVRYQASNGWQTKVVPDSRALIKLGLGPDNEHLLNPESAMTTAPQIPPRAPETSGQRK
jgi:hypothetical protein